MGAGRSAPLAARVLIAACVLTATSPPTRARLVELKHFDKTLEQQGVGLEYTDDGLARLIALVRQEVPRIEERAATASGRKRAHLQLLAGAIHDELAIAATIHASSNADAKAAAFPALKSLLYSIRSDLQGRRTGGKIAILFNVLRNLSLERPYLGVEERRRPLTIEQARLEAVNLLDPETGATYATPDALVGLSSDQVSRLDVREDNFLWMTEAELGRVRARQGTAWRGLESRVEAHASNRIHAPYKIEQARRILEFDGVKSGGTTPKILTRDLHDYGWTIKWGDEVHSEALATRLYIELGGKFADLVYANDGRGDDLVLVLNASDVVGAEGACEQVATFEGFAECLRTSTYEFDVSAHVVEHGVITADVLRREPFASAGDAGATLVGREFVTFNESLVAFEPRDEDFLRLGGGPLSSGGALDDRVKRALVVLTYWIYNKDAKDHNNHGVIDRESAAYLEYMHDLGASLGSLAISGSPNRLSVGDRFLVRRGHSVRYRDNMLYVPKAFRRATFADELWMARKIVALSRETILDSVAATSWPDFQQQVMASRLIARRNQIARAYDLGEPISNDTPPMTVSLRSPEERLDAARRYGLTPERLEAFMRESGIAIEGGRAEFEDHPTVSSDDGVLETNDCRKSVLIALFERSLHPTGLARRLGRHDDEEPLPICQPTRRSLGLGSR